MAEYYVRSTGGSDGNTGLTFAQGWATLAYAFSSSTTGDTLYVCSSESSPFILPSTFTVSSGRKFIGCDLVDGTAYTGETLLAHIMADGSTSGSTLINMNNNNNGSLWQSIVFDSAAVLPRVIDIVADAQVYDCEFRNCKIKNSNTYGVYINTSTVYDVTYQYGLSFFNCKIFDCGQNGVNINSATDTHYFFDIYFDNCEIYSHNLSNIHIDAPVKVFLFNTRCYNSGEDGVRILHSSNISGYLTAYNSVFATNDGNGIYYEAGSNNIIGLDVFNCIIAHNGSYGIYKATPDAIWVSGSHNCFYNNTSGDVSAYINGGTIPGYGNVTRDPLLTNITAGTEDFSLNNNSPCINAGYGYEGGK